MAVGDSAYGVLPIALGKPTGCAWGDGRALNGGSYADGLIVAGGAVCPTDRASDEYVPYYWRDSGWIQASLPDDTFYDGYINAVSDNPAAPVMVYVMRRSDGDDVTPDGLALLVVEAGQAPVELPPLPDMRLVHGSAAISASGNAVVAHSATGDWEVGYTYRAVRWIRTGTGWSAPQDIGEGTALAASADGRIVVGNGDGQDWGATGGNAWVWVDGDDDSGVVTALGADARVVDITQSGSMIVGSRPEPCSPDVGCDFYAVPVYWVQDGGQWVMHDLPTLAGAEASVMAVAELDGQPVILGEWVFWASFTLRAGVWLPDASGAYGAPLMLETLGANPDSIAFAYDINREGIVLGWSELEPWGDGSSVLWSLKETLPIEINGGMSDAWYDPAADGQGFFITVWQDIQMMFVGWFTYGDDGAGESRHYWMTAQGSYADDRAELGITVSEGGAFVAGEPAPMRHPDGTMTVEFHNCLEGSVSFDIPSMGRQGSVPIQRITRDNVVSCEKQAAGVQ